MVGRGHRCQVAPHGIAYRSEQNVDCTPRAVQLRISPTYAFGLSKSRTTFQGMNPHTRSTNGELRGCNAAEIAHEASRESCLFPFSSRTASGFRSEPLNKINRKSPDVFRMVAKVLPGVPRCHPELPQKLRQIKRDADVVLVVGLGVDQPVHGWRARTRDGERLGISLRYIPPLPTSMACSSACCVTRTSNPRARMLRPSNDAQFAPT
jgi:hypothetical protein